MKVILIVDDNSTNLRTLGEMLRPFYRSVWRRRGRRCGLPAAGLSPI